MLMVTIIDYGMGNLGSVANMLRKIGVPSQVAANPDDILKAEKLILPGVGAFDVGMTNLKNRGLIPVLNESVITKKTPILGICLGMQLLTSSSEEGSLPGLNWFNANTKRFRFEPNQKEGRFPLRVPHMAWKSIEVHKSEPLFKDLLDSKFYFVHGYYVEASSEDTSAYAYHGHKFSAAIQKENIFGVQFHPEKSHRFGFSLLKNFSTV